MSTSQASEPQPKFGRCPRRVPHPKHVAEWSDNTQTWCDGQPDRRLISYDLPVTPNLLGRLIVPDDLTEAEGERICRIVRALAMPDNQGSPT